MKVQALLFKNKKKDIFVSFASLSACHSVCVCYLAWVLQEQGLMGAALLCHWAPGCTPDTYPTCTQVTISAQAAAGWWAGSRLLRACPVKMEVDPS